MIYRLVNESLRSIDPVIDAERVMVFVSDAAPYMIKAGKVLQALFPKMIHVTCIAHALSL